MSLFVGNISKYVKTFELEDEFKQFGHCEIKRNVSNGSYAFIEYEQDKDADAAMNQLQGLNLKGLEIGIEWSKRSAKFDPRDSKRPPRRESDSKCYNCNRIGHFARECRSRRRSRSHSGERRGGGRRDSRSQSPRDRRRDYRDDRRRSPDRRRRSPRRDSYERRDDRDHRDRRNDRREDSYDRRDDRGRDDQWRDAGKPQERRSFSRGGSPRTPMDGDQHYRRRSPIANDEPRRRSVSRHSERKPAVVDERADRPAKSPHHESGRVQGDEREIPNNPERQEAPRTPRGGDDGPAKTIDNKD